MIDPETARQAWADVVEEWGWATNGVVLRAGDALAELVPQLLDRLGETAHLDDALNARLRAENVQLLNQLAEAVQRGDEWREENTQLARQSRALESEKAQLLDQLAETERVHLAWLDRSTDVIEAEVGALRERVRTLEAALRTMVDWHERGDQNLPHTFERFVVDLNAARAALGDTPPREFYEDDEDPQKVGAAFNAGEKGYTTGTRNVTYRGDTPPSPYVPPKFDKGPFPTEPGRANASLTDAAPLVEPPSPADG